jgi:hypothetical protein
LTTALFKTVQDQGDVKRKGNNLPCLQKGNQSSLRIFDTDNHVHLMYFFSSKQLWRLAHLMIRKYVIDGSEFNSLQENVELRPFFSVYSRVMNTCFI